MQDLPDSILIRSTWSTGQQTVITRTDDKLEKKEELKAEKEYKKLELKTKNKIDPISKYLASKNKLENLGFYNKFTRGDFPLDEKGYRMRVEKYYPALNLIVDLIPSSYSNEYIQSKKWLMEEMGFDYTWLKEGEVIREENVFWQRAARLEAKPKFEIKPKVFWTK